MGCVPRSNFVELKNSPGATLCLFALGLVNVNMMPIHSHATLPLPRCSLPMFISASIGVADLTARAQAARAEN